MVAELRNRMHADIHILRVLLSKLLNITQCCPPARFLLKCLLETPLKACPAQGHICLTPQFWKNLAWFDKFLPDTNGVFLLHEDTRVPLPGYIDACTTGVGAVLLNEAYYTLLPAHVLEENRPIFYLGALNAMVAITTWADKLQRRLVHLFCDNATAVVVYKAG